MCLESAAMQYTLWNVRSKIETFSYREYLNFTLLISKCGNCVYTISHDALINDAHMHGHD